MVDAEEGNSWIYKNKDHGEKHGPNIHPVWTTLHPFHRDVVCGCEPRSQFTVGY